MAISLAAALASLLIGVIAGLRTMTALAAVSWAARTGVLYLHGTWLAFLGYPLVAWILTAAAIAEFFTDQLPTTPSRKTAVQFGARVLSGAISGGAVGTAAGSWTIGTAAGILGAIFGTVGGSAFRTGLASTFRRDRPAALIEDVVAIGGAALVLGLLV